jgi:hypothetical protein
LYKAFYNEQKLLKADTAAYLDNLKQALSFTGDHASLLELEKRIMLKTNLLIQRIPGYAHKS